MVESKSHAGYPRDTRAGHPPTKSEAATRSSISRETGSTSQSQHGSEIVADVYLPEKAALCQLRHGDGASEEVVKAITAESDLITRTWKADKEPDRNERRLLQKYKSTRQADREASITAYLACARCQDSTKMENQK